MVDGLDEGHALLYIVITLKIINIQTLLMNKKQLLLMVMEKHCKTNDTSSCLY